jgi:hypothetical protein
VFEVLAKAVRRVPEYLMATLHNAAATTAPAAADACVLPCTTATAPKVLSTQDFNESVLVLLSRMFDRNAAYYRAHGVPVVLSTDDEGVLRTDMTNEYVRAVREQRRR